MLLKFIADAFYNGAVKYQKGSTHEISNELGEADRWLKRQVAIEVQEAPVTWSEIDEPTVVTDTVSEKSSGESVEQSTKEVSEVDALDALGGDSVEVSDVLVEKGTVEVANEQVVVENKKGSNKSNKGK